MKIKKIEYSEKTKLHRKTIDKRISALIKEGLISSPLCRFPNFFVPPNYLLTLSLVQLKKTKEKVIKEMIMDPAISIMLQTIHGKYNLLVFGNHRNINDHLEWEEKYRNKFPDSFKSVSITYLSPEMTISFSQQFVSLCYLRNKLKFIAGKDIRKPLRSLGRARAHILHKIT